MHNILRKERTHSHTKKYNAMIVKTTASRPTRKSSFKTTQQIDDDLQRRKEMNKKKQVRWKDCKNDDDKGERTLLNKSSSSSFEDYSEQGDDTSSTDEHDFEDDISYDLLSELATSSAIQEGHPQHDHDDDHHTSYSTTPINRTIEFDAKDESYSSFNMSFLSFDDSTDLTFRQHHHPTKTATITSSLEPSQLPNWLTTIGETS